MKPALRTMGQLRRFAAVPRRASRIGVGLLIIAMGAMALASMSSANTLWSQQLELDANLTTAAPQIEALALLAAPAECDGMKFDNVLALDAPGTLEGTPGNDLLVGSEGDDRIFGEGGDDCILGGDGNDLCSGGEGDNRIIACEPAAGPEDLRANFNEDSEAVDLEWLPVRDAASYAIFVSTDGSEYEQLDLTSQPDYEHRGVEPGVNYRYYVVAIDPDGFWSQPSDEASVDVPNKAKIVGLQSTSPSLSTQSDDPPDDTTQDPSPTAEPSVTEEAAIDTTTPEPTPSETPVP